MNELLLVYKQVQLLFDDNGNILCADENATITLSYDEKPGIQSIANTSPERRPTPKGGTTGGCILICQNRKLQQSNFAESHTHKTNTITVGKNWNRLPKDAWQGEDTSVQIHRQKMIIIKKIIVF